MAPLIVGNPEPESLCNRYITNPYNGVKGTPNFGKPLHRVAGFRVGWGQGFRHVGSSGGCCEKTP